MDSVWFDLGVSAVLTTLKKTIKNPKSKAVYRDVMLKIFNTIKLAYPGDPDFQ